MNKCQFELGKTYKTRDGRDALIIATADMLICNENAEKVIAILEGKHYCYYKSGRFALTYERPHDLMPPLKKIIGGIYRDNHGDLRVLISTRGCFECPVIYQSEFNLNRCYFVQSQTDWTKHSEYKYKLVELVADPSKVCQDYPYRETTDE